MPEGTITEVANKLIGSKPIERKTIASGFDVEEAAKAVKITPDLFTLKSDESAERLKGIVPEGFTTEDTGGLFTNKVLVRAPNGKTYTYNSDLSAEKAVLQTKSLEQFINDNTPKAAATTTGTAPVATGVGSKYNKK